MSTALDVSEALYDTDTTNLLVYTGDKEYLNLALDKMDHVIDWLNTLSRRKLRKYKEPIGEILFEIKWILHDINNATRGRPGNKDRD